MVPIGVFGRPRINSRTADLHHWVVGECCSISDKSKECHASGWLVFSVKTCRGGVCHGSLGETRGLRGPCSSRVGCHGRQYHFPGTVLVV